MDTRRGEQSFKGCDSVVRRRFWRIAIHFHVDFEGEQRQRVGPRAPERLCPGQGRRQGQVLRRGPGAGQTRRRQGPGAAPPERRPAIPASPGLSHPPPPQPQWPELLVAPPSSPADPTTLLDSGVDCDASRIYTGTRCAHIIPHTLTAIMPVCSHVHASVHACSARIQSLTCTRIRMSACLPQRWHACAFFS